MCYNSLCNKHCCFRVCSLPFCWLVLAYPTSADLFVKLGLDGRVLFAVIPFFLSDVTVDSNNNKKFGHDRKARSYDSHHLLGLGYS